MPDILLVYPKSGNDVRGVSVNAPMALLTIAAQLVPDFSVQIIDQRACDDFWGALERALKTRPLLAGVTSMTGTQIYHGLEITKFIREHSRTPVVWGGMHPTIYPAQTAAKPYIDFVIRGEGELALRALVEQLADRRPSFERVPGLVWKEHGELRATPQGEPIDLDRLSRLPWNLVDIEEYVTPAQYMYPGIGRLLPFQASRGCPFKCTFCSEPVLTKKYRMMSPERAIDECLEMAERFRLDHIVFFDEEFFIHRRWAGEMAKRIAGRFSWNAQTRATDLLNLDLQELERCGLSVILPGLESGSNRMLAEMKKRETVADYRKANARLGQTKIWAQYNFIIGFPSETADELDETVDLVLELLAANPKALVNQLSPLTPLPGTELLEEAVRKHGFALPKRLEDWISITRGRQERPWLDAKMLRRVRFLYYTSLFLCSAERYSQKLHIPKWVFQLYSWTIHARWRRKWYGLDWDVPVLRLLFRWFISPLDFSFPKDYGDAHAARESDLRAAARGGDGDVSETVNLGILGAGKMAYWHLRAYRRVPGVRVAAICNPKSERGKSLARRFAIPRVCRDADELFAVPGLQAVDVSAPTGLHKDLICRALERGLHVYTEKPLCRTVEEADAVVEAGRKAGKIVFVGYNLRFCPEFQQAKRILDSGELGAARFVWIQRGAWVDRDSYIFNRDWNAGIITELSSHALDLLRWWGFREIQSVYAAGANVFPDFPGPDTVSLNIKLRDGTLAVVSNSYGLPSLSTEVCVVGAKKLLRIKYGKCWVEPHPRRWSIPGLLLRTLREAVVYPYRILYNPFVGSCRHFIDCVRSGRAPLIDARDARETLRLCRLLERSYATASAVAAEEA